MKDRKKSVHPEQDIHQQCKKKDQKSIEVFSCLQFTDVDSDIRLQGLKADITAMKMSQG